MSGTQIGGGMGDLNSFVRMTTPFKTPKTRRNLRDLKDFIDASRRGDYSMVTQS